MKTLTTALILSLSAMAGAVHAAPVASHAPAAATAGEETVVNWLSEPGTRSRAEVRAELDAARAAGQLRTEDRETFNLTSSGDTLSRDQVRDELRQYRAAHGDDTIPA